MSAFKNIAKKFGSAIGWVLGLVVTLALMGTGAYFAWGFHKKRETLNEAEGDVVNPKLDADRRESARMQEAVWRLLEKSGHGKKKKRNSG